MAEIKESIANAVRYLTEHPDEARYTDSYARATLRDALRADVEGPAGERIVTDMPAGIGGKGEHPSPGWLYRAAIGSCVAATIGMEAARDGVVLNSLEVEVDSESDDRGILGMDEEIPPGPLSTRIRIRAQAEGVDEGRLREILERGAGRCPVSDATQRAVEVTVGIEAS
jgi:uncharacterized OsmC-like protein